MKAVPTTVALLLMFASLAAAGRGTDYDPKADFSSYRTFSWKEGTPAPSELTEDRIRAAVQRELEAKGMEESPEDPDLYVVTHVSVHVEQRVDVDHFGYDTYPGYRSRALYGRPYRSYPSSVRVYEIPIGTLVVDLVDARTGKLVWQGTTSDTVDRNAKPEKRERRINKKVGKLLQKYPPKR
jgi:hypothetical protein